MIGSVVRAGWLNLRRDRAALMLSFVVPIVFFSIFAGIFGAQRRTTPKVALAVADEDKSDSSRQLIEALGRQMIGWFIQYEEERLQGEEKK